MELVLPLSPPIPKKGRQGGKGRISVPTFHRILISLQKESSVLKYCTKESLPTGKKIQSSLLGGKKISSLKTQSYSAYVLFRCILLSFIPLNDGLKKHYINNSILV